MKAEIISVGTELLLGDILNTNARFLSQQLSMLGISIYNQQVVGDNPKRLKEAVELAKSRSDIVVLSGGLGPTDDDLTKQTVAEIYHDTLVYSQQVAQQLQTYFQKMGREMTPNNEKQAYVPQKGKMIPNENGTAPGALFMDGERLAVLLPGPPKELEPMVQNHVLPLLKKLVKGVILSRYVHAIGIGESALEDKISPLLQTQNPTMALYAKEGEVLVRLTAKAENTQKAQEMLDNQQQQLQKIIPEYIYGIDVKNIETVLVNKLIETKQTLATAESCTGGRLSARITSVPGASEVFGLGICTYSNEQKMQMLEVNRQDLETYTAVSSIVAAQMAQGVRKKAGSDFALATTGYAGPSGGTPQEPVGTVYIALAHGEKTYVKKCFFSGDRDKISHLACQSAFDLLRGALLGLPLTGVKIIENNPVGVDQTLEQLQEWDEKPKKKFSLGKTLLSILVMLIIATALAFGWIFYSNGGQMPQFDFSKSALLVFKNFGNQQAQDIPKLLESRQDLDFFSQGFEKATLKMLNSLSAQNQEVKGWITFKSAKKEFPITTQEFSEKQENKQLCLFESKDPAIDTYTFLQGLTADNFIDFTDIKNAKENSKFTIYSDNGYVDYQIFSVGTFNTEELAALTALESRQEFIVNAKARSLYEVDVIIKESASLYMLCQQRAQDEYVVLFAVNYPRDNLPSLDPKQLVVYAPWYAAQQGIENQDYDLAIEYAQESFDKDNFDMNWIGVSPSPAPEGSAKPETSPQTSSSPSPSPGKSPSPSVKPSPGTSAKPSPAPSEKPSVSAQPSPTPTPTPKPTSTPQPTSPPDSSEPTLTVTMNGVVTTGPATQILSQIVAIEMTYTWNPEALKAQAIATHTFLRHQYASGNSAPAVNGRTSPNQAVVNAVKEVSDKIMTINGQAVYTPYCASVAGRTNSSADVWGNNLSHLQSVESKYDFQSTGYEKAFTFTQDQVRTALEEKLGITLDDNPGGWIEILDYTAGGYVGNMRIGGQTTYYNKSLKRNTNITGRWMREDILAATGTTIRSAAFDVSYADGIFTFTTRGYGHGAGMSQWGAQLYAQNEGWNYSQILQHYYTGVSITSVS